jgi:hypothetical protein
MDFEHVTSYAATPEQVRTMLTDRAFRERVCEAQRARDHTVTVTGEGAATTVEIERTQAMDGAPSVATKVVGDSVRILQRERWTGPDSADYSMEIPGKPGQMRGVLRLRPRSDGGCDEVVSGEIAVKVPLVGRKLEQLVESILVKALVREGEVGADWLRKRSR